MTDSCEEHNKIAEKKIIDDVKEYGWHVALFEENANAPSFAYTIGLWRSYAHPEIICFGLPVQVLHAMLNNAGEKVKEGKALMIGEDDLDILENCAVRYRNFKADEIQNHLGYAMWYHEYKNFPVIEMIWPDKQGNFK